MRLALLLMLALLAIAPSHAEVPARKDVLRLASRVADWQLSHLDAASKGAKGWEQGAFWVGMTHFAESTGEKRYSDAIMSMGRSNQWELGDRLYHADDQVIGQAYLWAAAHGAGADALKPIQTRFDEILNKPPVVHLSFYFAKDYGEAECLKRWCWCDALFMAPPAWVDLSRQTSDARYAEYAMREFWASTDFLYDPAEKLYFRDSRFFERRDAQGRKLFWSRGNGWVFAGIANILAILPPDHRDRPRLEALFRAMAERLKGLQKSDGYWPPSLLAPENSPAETSGTGFFVYGLAWGVNHGLLESKDYAAAIEKGWSALTRAVAKDGRLGWVQQVSDRPDAVAEADTQFYGVGALLLAASEVAALGKGS